MNTNPNAPIISGIVLLISLGLQLAGHALLPAQVDLISTEVTNVIMAISGAIAVWKSFGVKASMAALRARVAMFEKQTPPPTMRNRA